ncbi:hypothetical protein LCGC14_0207970 [marine sediment metagenome]|uniref:Uncharacterized protein n=1 Tax=marine sediment metagenome TaxID=412755 RepID=A0A0F9X0N1_9ZZZZ
MKAIELLDKEELLLESEGWAVIHDSGTDYRTQHVYGSHEACTLSYNPNKPAPGDPKFYYGEYCWEIDCDPICLHCEAPVPDGIQAVVRLRNWGLEGGT